MCGMAGFRIDHLMGPRRKGSALLMLIWAIGIAISVFAAFAVAGKLDLTGALVYFGLAWAFYYVGNTLILTSPLRRTMIDRMGDEKAFRAYEVMLGLMFANQALAFGVVLEARWLNWPPLATAGVVNDIGLLLIGAGFVIKTWAALTVGLDIYYYKDMFLGRSTGEFTVSGPYRFTKNPMYGLGNVQIYGLALFHFSVAGLVAAAICHLSIFAFYYIAERPAIKRIYGSAAYA